jgi:type IV secretion system protein VirD4
VRPPPGATSTPDRQGPDWWFPWLVAGFGVATILVWLAAAIAAALHGSNATIRLTDAGVALLHLPAHGSDPRLAWPVPERDVLPGPAVYWTCQAGVVLAVAAGIVGARRTWQRLNEPTGPLGARADAGFAKRRDMRALTVGSPVAGRVTIGWAHGKLLACEPQASLAVVGPSGCGKTVGFAIPALLEWRGPVIATSVKTDLLDATIEHRRRRGEVWVYDPARVSGQAARSPWSPLACVVDWTDAMRLSASMVEVIRPRRDNVEDANYWYSQAAKGLAPYLYAAAVAGLGLTDVVRWVDTQHVDHVENILRRHVEWARVDAWDRVTSDEVLSARWDDLYEETIAVFRRMVASAPDERSVLASLPVQRWPLDLIDDILDSVEAEWQFEMAHAAGDPVAPLAAAQALWSKESRLRGSVYATMEIVLRSWADPGVGALARPDSSEIDVDKWLSGDNTIYVVAQAHEHDRLRPVLTVLMQQAIRRAYDTATREGGRLSNRALVLLDEAGNIAPLPDLPGYVSTARSHGITLVTVWQDLAQINSTYGERGRTILNNHRAKLFGTGIGDEVALEYVSRMVGDEQRTERNLSTDLHGGRRSVSEHQAYRRAAPADLVRRIPPGDAVLIYGSDLPTRVRLRPWFGDRSLRSIASRPDLIDSEAGT